MVIVIQCTDKVGLVAAISVIMAKEKINIVSMREHVDKSENRFFARLEVDYTPNANAIEQELINALPADAFVKVNPEPSKKIILLVTREYHCLADILIRNHFKTLGATVKCVIGNHEILGDVCSRFEVPFHHVGHEEKSKPEFEKALLDTINKYHADFLVLAKFMRILSPEFMQKFPMRIINIHHSFLPAFAGASPYRQAYDHGVKLIGATSHFVTDELDEGPIIAQQIIPVTHSFTTADMVRAGKEIETAVLAKAMQLVLEDRVVVYKNKTVIFE